MRHLVGILAVILCVSASQVKAQTSESQSATATQAHPIDPTKAANIRLLIERLDLKNLILSTFKSGMEMKRGTDESIPAKFWDEAEKQAADSIESFVDLVIPIYDKYYTADDIKQLLDVYQMPIMQKSVKMAPMISNEAMQVGMEWGRQLGARVASQMIMKGEWTPKDNDEDSTATDDTPAPKKKSKKKH